MNRFSERWNTNNLRSFRIRRAHWIQKCSMESTIKIFKIDILLKQFAHLLKWEIFRNGTNTILEYFVRGYHEVWNIMQVQVLVISVNLYCIISIHFNLNNVFCDTDISTFHCCIIFFSIFSLVLKLASRHKTRPSSSKVAKKCLERKKNSSESVVGNLKFPNFQNACDNFEHPVVGKMDGSYLNLIYSVSRCSNHSVIGLWEKFQYREKVNRCFDSKDFTDQENLENESKNEQKTMDQSCFEPQSDHYPQPCNMDISDFYDETNQCSSEIYFLQGLNHFIELSDRKLEMSFVAVITLFQVWVTDFPKIEQKILAPMKTTRQNICSFEGAEVLWGISKHFEFFPIKKDQELLPQCFDPQCYWKRLQLELSKAKSKRQELIKYQQNRIHNLQKRVANLTSRVGLSDPASAVRGDDLKGEEEKSEHSDADGRLQLTAGVTYVNQGENHSSIFLDSPFDEERDSAVVLSTSTKKCRQQILKILGKREERGYSEDSLDGEALNGGHRTGRTGRTGRRGRGYVRSRPFSQEHPSRSVRRGRGGRSQPPQRLTVRTHHRDTGELGSPPTGSLDTGKGKQSLDAILTSCPMPVHTTALETESDSRPGTGRRPLSRKRSVVGPMGRGAKAGGPALAALLNNSPSPTARTGNVSDDGTPQQSAHSPTAITPGSGQELSRAEYSPRPRRRWDRKQLKGSPSAKSPSLPRVSQNLEIDVPPYLKMDGPSAVK